MMNPGEEALARSRWLYWLPVMGADTPVRVTVVQAARGAEIEAPTIDEQGG